MRKTDFSKILKLSVIFVLIAAMALIAVSCSSSNSGTETTAATTGETEAPATSAESQNEEAKYTLTVTVVDDKGESTDFEIKTNADNLGDALIESGLVEGEESDYGLYIKVVNGLRADYDLDRAYWALSKNGEYLMTGADSTPIADGEKYELTYSK